MFLEIAKDLFNNPHRTHNCLDSGFEISVFLGNDFDISHIFLRGLNTQAVRYLLLTNDEEILFVKVDSDTDLDNIQESNIQEVMGYMFIPEAFYGKEAKEKFNTAKREMLEGFISTYINFVTTSHNDYELYEPITLISIKEEIIFIHNFERLNKRSYSVTSLFQEEGDSGKITRVLPNDGTVPFWLVD